MSPLYQLSADVSSRLQLVSAKADEPRPIFNRLRRLTSETDMNISRVNTSNTELVRRKKLGSRY